MKTTRFALLVTLTAGVLATSCGPGQSASTLDETSVELTDGSVLKPGKGFDSHSGVARGFCVNPTDLTSIDGSATAQRTFFEMKEISTVEELQQSLSINAAGAFNSGIYGGSASAHYASSSDFNEYTSYMMVHVQVTNQTKSLTGYSLTNDALKLKADKQAFFNLCGDRFVSGVTTGGEFYAVVEFKSKSEEQRQEISAKIRGSSGVWSLGADFASNMHSFAQYVETDIQILRVGGTGDLPGIGGVNKSVGNLIAYATQFPTIVSPSSGSAYPFTVTTEDYGVVGNYAITPIDLTIQQQVLDSLAADKFKANEIKGKARYITSNPDQFPSADLGAVNGAQNSANGIINKLNAAAVKCFNHPFAADGCVFPTDINWPVVAWPTRRKGDNTQSLCDKELNFLLGSGKINHAVYQSLKDDNLVPQYKDPTDRSKGTVGFGACSDVGVFLSYLWQ